MKQWTWLLGSVVFWCSFGGSAPSAYGRNWVIGNGGDGLRLVFEKAREHAGFIAVRMRDDMLLKSDSNVRSWILLNKDRIASDILQSDLQWVMEEKPTCAWTTQPDPADAKPQAAPIQLSFPTCQKTITNFVAATELLIHESVHHFGIDDEAFADKVALAIVQAWTTGGTHWGRMSDADAPSARKRHAAVWTGTEMIIVGGLNDATMKNVGSPHAYDPAKNRWRSLATQGAPARHFLQAIWTGRQLIAWGGYEGSGTTQSWQWNGMVWSPDSGSWTPLKSPIAWKIDPGASFVEAPRQSLTWTGSEAIIVGGVDQRGEPLSMAYNPTSGKWRRLAAAGSPERLAGHAAVWTGDELLIWGGYTGETDALRRLTTEGAIYSPLLDEWRPMSNLNGPKERYSAAAVWTGDHLVIFGGRSSRADIKGTGGIYDVARDKWEPTVSEIALERWGHTAHWTGKEMLIMGGAARFTRELFSNVLAFDLGSRSWQGLSSLAAPVPRQDHAAVWTGNSLLIWGGTSGFGQSLQDGAIFYP